ncbi:MAG: ZIP family metal transporter [Patescibacteria group bacterium UBA2103]
MITSLLIAGASIAAISLIGVISTITVLKKFFDAYARYFISFATGVFLVLIYSLVEEILHDGFSLSLFLYVLLGILFFYGLTKIARAHHHHGKTEAHNHSKIDAWRMLLGDTLHNIGDGILLVPIFLSSSVLGSAAVIGIIVHEMVQEIAEFFVLKEAGFSTAKALFFNFLTALAIFIGIFIGISVTDIEGVALPLLAFTTGGFIYLVLFDFMPSIKRSMQYECRKTPHIIFLLVGFFLMYFLTTYLGHGH